MWPIYLPFFSCLKNTVKYFLQSSHKFSFCFCLCLFVFLPSSPTSSSLFPFLFLSFLYLSPSPLSLLPSSLPSLFLLSDLNYRKILLLALTFFFFQYIRVIPFSFCSIYGSIFFIFCNTSFWLFKYLLFTLPSIQWIFLFLHFFVSICFMSITSNL